MESSQGRQIKECVVLCAVLSAPLKWKVLMGFSSVQFSVLQRVSASNTGHATGQLLYSRIYSEQPPQCELPLCRLNRFMADHLYVD